MSIDKSVEPILVVHGGCGVAPHSRYVEGQWSIIRNEIAEALLQGWKVLASGGGAVDAVASAICYLEDCPFFNAGHGASLNREGQHELDASIMCGATLSTGAVAAVKHIRNPILAAKRLADLSEAVFLVGDAADRFAQQQGLASVEQSYFSTRRQLRSFQRRRPLPDADDVSSSSPGTVGAVAVDFVGNFAAGSSTGGSMFKRPGRVGDTPIIGAGTYAKNGICAISCTGTGEEFIKRVIAHDISCRIEYGGESLQSACDYNVFKALGSSNSKAGLIAVDRKGVVYTPFNTAGMYRGWIQGQNEPHIYTH